MTLDTSYLHLPINRKEMQLRKWKELDVLLITGDAYFDHPSHGTAVIGRVLENAGYRVGIVARPSWKTTHDFTVMGRPALFVGITSGAVDSTLNNYTADLSRRRDDAYAPGKEGMGRPDFASLVYCNKIKEAFGKITIVLGGIEASTRRFSYFDYASSKIRRSILVDSRADILVYGPGEKQIIEIANKLAENKPLNNINGTAQLIRNDAIKEGVALPSHEAIINNNSLLIEQTKLLEQSMGPQKEKRVFQYYKEGFVVCEPPSVYTTEELDKIYELPFNKKAHPSYSKPISALETVRWSIVALRGCPGGCSFCALSMHQGREVISRSPDSIIKEIERLTKFEKFTGTISDIGGPTANAYNIYSTDKAACKKCKRPSCFYPNICEKLKTDHNSLIELLKQAAKVPAVKRVFLASGIRHDLALKDPSFIEYIAKHNTGGHLKVAPEHVSLSVLKLMRKPNIEQLEKFEKIFLSASRKANLKQYLVPYFIAGFPGCDAQNANLAKVWLQKRGQRLQQVQNFIPLPGTMAAAIYACKQNQDKSSVFIADLKERRRQKSILLGQEHHSPKKYLKK